MGLFFDFPWFPFLAVFGFSLTMWINQKHVPDPVPFSILSGCDPTCISKSILSHSSNKLTKHWKKERKSSENGETQNYLLFHIGFSVRNPPQFLLLQYLDSPATQCLWVQHLLYFPIRPLPQQVPHQILPNQLGPLPAWLVDHLCGVNAVDESVHPHQFMIIEVVVQMVQLSSTHDE